jgi:hypothetical protein
MFGDAVPLDHLLMPSSAEVGPRFALAGFTLGVPTITKVGASAMISFGGGRTVEFQAPRVSMTRPPPLWRSLLRGLSIPLGVVATVMVVVGIATHNSAMIFGGLAPIPFTVVVFAIEMPLIRMAQQRRRASVLRSSPAGTLFVAAATLETLAPPAGNPSGSSPPLGSSLSPATKERGTLRVGVAGVTFIPKGRPTPTEMALSWQEIAEFTVTRPKSSYSREARLPNLRGFDTLGPGRDVAQDDDPTPLYDVLTELEAQWSKSAVG